MKPNVGGAWLTDELFVKFSGDMKYMYAFMDDKTRFWIAQQVAGTKYTADIRPLFRKVNEITGIRPTVLISDGAPNYNQVFIDLYQYTLSNQIKRASKIEHVIKRIKGVIDDLCELGLIKREIVGKRSGTTDIITIYRYTFVGYVIALLVETMESGKQSAISTELHNMFDSYFKDHFSSYNVLYAALFKKYIDRGLFNEFGIDILISRLNSDTEIKTIDHLIERLDLVHFDDTKKAKLYVELLLKVLNELDPNIRQLLFHDIKLQYQ